MGNYTLEVNLNEDLNYTINWIVS